ncbi:MAG: S1 RNA-binding domain-containing protein [Phycisphaeraceae bacterium]|nr:MAG: S1 RNA-binding domain-containing protein [Phycisphaeraceae bacterium]
MSTEPEQNIAIPESETPETATHQMASPEAAVPKAPEPTTAAPPTTPVHLGAEIEAEIEAAMAELEAANAPTPGHPAKAKLRGPRVVEGGREHRTGTVVSVGPTDIFVEFGPKELGVLDRAQFKNKDGEEPDLPKVGEQAEVVVQRYEASESLYICARPGAVQKADWEMLEQGQVVEARVTGVNKGGLELEIAQHRAFMPASQVDLDHVKDLSVFVGEKLECIVQRVDRRGKGNIVLSRREVLQSQRAEAAASLREALQEGQTIEGTVRKIMDFGAFVDLGGVDGLIHISDLSHDRVNHGAKNIERHVSEGQKIRVQILKLDWDANRISLGLKQLQADPFAAAASEVVEGAVLTGKVTNIADFGCFVEVAPGVEGLVHISELDYRRVAQVSDVVQQGEVVQVKVLKIDPQTRKVSLSIKATKDAPAQAGGGGGAPRGRGRGRGDRDDRDPNEILKETPKLRRMREAAKKRDKDQKKSGQGGLGDVGGLGLGLGDLKL